MTERRSVVVASSDRLFCEVAALHLARGSTWRVVGTAHDGVEAAVLVARLQPTALLVLGQLGRLGAAALAQQVSHRWPQVRVVILGDTERERDALGTEVLPTGSDTRAVLLALSRGASTRAPLGPTTHLDEAARLKALTRQERTILRLIAEGQPNREIARTLELSQHTVRTHKQNLYQKLGCHRRLDIVRLAMRHGLVTERGG